MAGAIPSRGPVQNRWADGAGRWHGGRLGVWGLWVCGGREGEKDEPAETSGGSTCRFGRTVEGECGESGPCPRGPSLDSRSLLLGSPLASQPSCSPKCHAIGRNKNRNPNVRCPYPYRFQDFCHDYLFNYLRQTHMPHARRYDRMGVHGSSCSLPASSAANYK